MSNIKNFKKNLAVKLILGFICMLSFFIPINIAYSEDSTPNIRVLLAKGIVSATFHVTDGEYRLIDGSNGLTIGNPTGNEKWLITVTGKSFAITKDGENLGSYIGPILLKPSAEGFSTFSYGNVRYRNMLSFESNAGTLLAINTVDIEKYLYGVVGKEIGYGVSEEALKAQAVVSRSFALSSKGGNLKYDVTNDTSSQVYAGYSAEIIPNAEKVKKAIDATAGEVIYYYDVDKKITRLVKAYFHANSGGYTEDSENVWSEYLPYIRAVASPFDKKALTYSPQSGGWPASTYQWEKVFTKEELQKQIEKWNNVALSRKQSYNIIDVGDFLGVYAFNYKQDGITSTDSKRATRLDIVGTKGTKSFFKDAIRSVFDLKSTKFSVSTGSAGSALYVIGINGDSAQTRSTESLHIASDIKDTLYNPIENGVLHIIGQNEVTTQQQDISTVTFNGYGYGHGLGMSQWGARGMADAGYNYKEIIEHYYNQDNKDGRLTISKNY